MGRPGEVTKVKPRGTWCTLVAALAVREGSKQASMQQVSSRWILATPQKARRGLCCLRCILLFIRGFVCVWLKHKMVSTSQQGCLPLPAQGQAIDTHPCKYRHKSAQVTTSHSEDGNGVCSDREQLEIRDSIVPKWCLNPSIGLDRGRMQLAK